MTKINFKRRFRLCLKRSVKRPLRRWCKRLKAIRGPTLKNKPVLKVLLISSPFLFIVFFAKIDVVSPGTGIISGLHSNILIKSPSKGFIVKINVKEGDEVQVGDLLYEYNNYDDGIHLKSVITELEYMTDLLSKYELDKCNTNQLLLENATSCELSSLEKVSYFYQSLLDKKSFVEMKGLTDQNKMGVLEELKKTALQEESRVKSKVRLIGRVSGHSLKYIDANIELSKIKASKIQYSLQIETLKQTVISDGEEFRKAVFTRLISLDEKITALKGKVNDNIFKKELLIIKTEYSKIKSSVQGTVLSIEDGAYENAYINESKPIMQLKNDDGKQLLDAKFDTKYRPFLFVGSKVKISINSPKFKDLYLGRISRISTDSFEYKTPGKKGMRYFAVDIEPESPFFDDHVNENVGVSTLVYALSEKISTFNYIFAILSKNLTFNVW